MSLATDLFEVANPATPLAERLLNWRPAVGLEEGLRRTIEWITKHADRYRPGTYAV